MVYKQLVWLAVFGIFFLVVDAIPTPSGIDGVIYELDGITQVPKGVSFSVENQANNFVVEGSTGHGSPGRYSVSLPGETGDPIIVRAWNEYNSANLTLSLKGVMRGVNFLLNMSVPQFPPNITTLLLPDAVEEEEYTFHLQAVDENEDDTLEFAFLKAPAGMSLDAMTGAITWLPLQQDVGAHEILVELTDTVYIVNRSLTLVAHNVNDPPSIISIPVNNVSEDTPYMYDVDAVDEDGDLLTYSLVQHPVGMSINTTTGRITWFPNGSAIGLHTVMVEASDNNLTDTQSFALNVFTSNQFPFITSFPPTQIDQDAQYVYVVEATDLDEDALVYELSSPPPGMAISENGTVTWVPGQEDVGMHNITITVSDEEGSDIQAYTLLVRDVNDPPVFVNLSPPALVRERNFFDYTFTAFDPDGDNLGFYKVDVPEPSKMFLDTGRLLWLVQRHQLGEKELTVKVSDGEAETFYSFTVEVIPLKTTIVVSKATNETVEVGEDAPDLFINFINGSASEEVEENFTQPLMEKNVYSYDDPSFTFIKELSSKPESVLTPETLVYKYIEIFKYDPGEETFTTLLGFKVDKGWLEQMNITKEEVVMRRFVDDMWTSLPTTIVDEDEGYVYYAAYTPGFSFFAITLKQGVKGVFFSQPSTKVFAQPYTLFGEVTSTFGKLLDSVDVFIQNQETGERVHAITGLQSPPGVYAGTVQGKKGDVIKIVAGEKTAFITVGEENLIRTDFSLKGEITGSVLGNFGMGGVPVLGVFLLALALFALIAVRIKYQKSEKK